MGVIDFVTSRAGIAFFSLVLLVVAFTAIAAYFLGVYTPSIRAAHVLSKLKPVKNPADVSIALEVLQHARTGENGAPILLGLYLPQYENVVVFNVAGRKDLYGPGGSYHMLTGRDCSRCLATMDLKTTATNLDDLSVDQWRTLIQWGNKFLKQYPIMGHIAVEDTNTKRTVKGYDAPVPPVADLTGADDLPPFAAPGASSRPSSSSATPSAAASSASASASPSGRPAQSAEAEQKPASAPESEPESDSEPDFEMETEGVRRAEFLRSRHRSRY